MFCPGFKTVFRPFLEKAIDKAGSFAYNAINKIYKPMNKKSRQSQASYRELQKVEMRQMMLC